MAAIESDRVNLEHGRVTYQVESWVFADKGEGRDIAMPYAESVTVQVAGGAAVIEGSLDRRAWAPLVTLGEDGPGIKALNVAVRYVRPRALSGAPTVRIMAVVA